MGGNKPRKLEFLLGEAAVTGAKRVATYGLAGSNHVCATAIHSQRMGIPCDCFYIPQLRTQYTERNLKATYLTGNKMSLYETPEERDAQIEALKKACSDRGEVLYTIPGGGSNAMGAIGFVNAAFELKEDIAAGRLPQPDVIYITLGSKGSAAGLLLGLKAAKLAVPVVAVRVVSSATFDQIKKIFDATNDKLLELDPSFGRFELTPTDVVIHHDFFCGQYAKIDERVAQSIKTLAEIEGIKLDGTYSGKTFAALLYDLASNPELRTKNILFWDTFCSGLGPLEGKELDSVDYHALPPEFHRFFDGNEHTLPLQPLDQGF